MSIRDQETIQLLLPPSSPPIPPEGPLLPEGFRLSSPEIRKEQRTWYDTFEWQVWSKGLLVEALEGQLRIRPLTSAMAMATTPLSSLPDSFFPGLLEEGAVRQQLEAVVGVRALMKRCSIDVETTRWRLLDEVEKTIAFITAETLSVQHPSGNEPVASLIAVVPLRGYGAEAEAVAAAIEGAERIRGTELFDLVARRAGLEPGGYSSKIRLQLEANAPIHRSARQLMQHTLATMRCNEEGIRRDIDSEFLHDYRVAIRRTRSVLAQLKGVFDPDETAPFSSGLRELGKLTNKPRDLDVYLLARPGFLSVLPPSLQAGLEPFFRQLASARKRELRGVVRHLEAEGYRHFLDAWEEFLADARLPDPQKAANARVSTLEVARTTIGKAWRKVLRNGRNVSRETTDPELHALRLDCKKLRYLLEFFASLFPQKTATAAIRQLKELQENLGAFVDCSVQQEFLSSRLDDEMRPGGDTALAASLGGLLTALHMRQEEARSSFHQTFEGFDADTTETLFQELLNPRKKS